jgi:hypothetical protein
MSIDKVEILREVAEFACENLQPVLNEKSDYPKSFKLDEISETLLINNSTFIKMKRVRDKDDDWGTCDLHKQWQNGNEEEEEEEKEEEEEEEEVEPLFLPHPPMYGGFTWVKVYYLQRSTRNSLVTSTLHSRCTSWMDITGTSKTNFILVQLKLMNPMKCWSPTFLLKTS